MGESLSRNNNEAEAKSEQLDLDVVRKEFFDPKLIAIRHDNWGQKEIEGAVSEAEKKSSEIGNDLASKKLIAERVEQDIVFLEGLRSDRLDALNERISSLIVQLKKTLKLDDAVASGLSNEAESFSQEIEALEHDLLVLKKEAGDLSEAKENLPAPAKMLEAYYEKMATMPLSNQEKRDYLTPEILSSLTTEEYIALWRRLNPYYLSHVTRQGFRDHTGMMEHSRGVGEFQDGFIGAMESGAKLQPPFAVMGLVDRNPETVKKFMAKILEAETEEQALFLWNAELNQSSAVAEKYLDKTAVHFAAQQVSDSHYGGESGNEVFFLYPSDVIASQHKFAFNMDESGYLFAKPTKEKKWNDVFVWPGEITNPGIPVDMGLVFLPTDQLVDPVTGSKYDSEPKVIDGKETIDIIQDEVLTNSFVKWTSELDESSPVIERYRLCQRQTGLGDRAYIEESFIRLCSDELEAQGFDSEPAINLSAGLFDLMSKIDSSEKSEVFSRENLIKLLSRTKSNWKRALNAIPAKEYWEKKFTANPALRPKHVIYYTGDPTAAVSDFFIKNDIGGARTDETEGQFLGFDDHVGSTGERDAENERQCAELQQIGIDIINEHYKES